MQPTQGRKSMFNTGGRIFCENETFCDIFCDIFCHALLARIGHAPLRKSYEIDLFANKIFFS